MGVGSLAHCISSESQETAVTEQVTDAKEIYSNNDGRADRGSQELGRSFRRNSNIQVVRTLDG